MIHVETHQHPITKIGFTKENSVVITFDNGPFDGEAIIPADEFNELAAAHNKRKVGWIATEGKDLLGHDFGCEWIWVMWRGFSPSLEYPSAPGVEPEWGAISHWMATDIKTPEPPE